MNKSLLGVLALSLALSGCAGPQTRVRSALTQAGLSKPVAACMAERMTDRLSIWQLNKLRGLGKLRDSKLSTITMEEFFKRTKSLQDPEILGVVTSSGVICAVKA
jgi:hypothetical protein